MVSKVRSLQGHKRRGSRESAGEVMEREIASCSPGREGRESPGRESTDGQHDPFSGSHLLGHLKCEERDLRKLL